MLLKNPPVVVSDKPTAALYQTFERRSTTLASATITSGRLTLSAIYLPAGVTVSSLSFATAGTALATPTHGWAALFDPSYGLLGQSADDVAITWASFTVKTFTLTAPVVTSVSGWHYIGVMVTATTMPTLAAVVPSAAVEVLVPVMGGLSTSSLTTTAPSTAATPGTTSLVIPYGYVS